MKKIYIYSILLLSLFACEKYVDIPAPTNELGSGVIFTDDRTATAAVVGIYSNMNAMNYQFNVLTCMLGGFSADELKYRYTSADFSQFENNSLIYSNTYLSRLWSFAYSYIYAANACIEGLTENVALTEDVRKQLLGEAKFVRAFSHFYLVNMFGDVPLITTTDFAVNSVMPRTPTAQLYTTIINDLKDAQGLMQDDYVSTERIRPNKATATALLARAYLYTEQWSQAEAEASKIISNTLYDLDTLNGVFLKNSKEAIWQLQTVNPNGWNAWEGNIFASQFCQIKTELANAFEHGDERKTKWLKQPASLAYYYPFKYKIARSMGTPVSEYSMVLRLAEQYLIRAEARVQQNTSTSLAGAKADIDELRLRANLNVFSGTLDKPSLLTAIEKERQVELFSEWGHRWFDLKRTGRATTVLAPVKADWQPTDMLYPIPESAMKTNKTLIQNP